MPMAAQVRQILEDILSFLIGPKLISPSTLGQGTFHLFSVEAASIVAHFVVNVSITRNLGLEILSTL
jgi:hypothetical protein